MIKTENGITLWYQVTHQILVPPAVLRDTVYDQYARLRRTIGQPLLCENGKPLLVVERSVRVAHRGSPLQ